MPKVELYTFFYKDAPVLKKDLPYIPIMAGKKSSQVVTTILGDNQGDSISEKNKYYSELTGVYWVWKNTHQDIVGSVHYRRFLTTLKEPIAYRLKRLLYALVGLRKKRFGLIYTKNVNRFKNYILNEEEILEILKSYDAILPQRRKLKYTIQEHYKRYHKLSDLELVRTIIEEKCPNYLSAFEKVISGNRLFANNIFVMKRADFDRCMEWLFALLFEFEKRINLSDYQGYQQRILGFMAERLLNVWFENENLKIKELPVIYFKHFKHFESPI